MEPTTADRTEVSVAVISAGVSDTSSTRLLADRLTAQLHGVLTGEALSVRTRVIEVASLAGDVTTTLVGGLTSDALRRAMDTIAHADIVIAATPVYKAGISGLFKSFIDAMDNDLLVGKTVLLAATAGTARHALVADEHLRSLFAYLRAVTVPTSLFAAPEDWADPALTRRMHRAAVETAALHRSHLQDDVLHRSWNAYQHQYASTTSRTGNHPADPDFDTPLMRLAAGGA